MAIHGRAGALRERVRFERLKGAQNLEGEVEVGDEDAWEHWFTTWAEVTPEVGGGIEEERARQGTSQRYTLRIRRDSRYQLTGAERAIWSGKTLDLGPPLDLEARRRFDLIPAVHHA